MIRGLYTAASALVSQLRRQDVVANNLANVETPGYKAEVSAQGSFETVLAQQVGSAAAPVPANFVRRLGIIGTGAYLQQRGSSMEQGSIRRTGEPLDLALQGPGFFAVQRDGGVAYTRDGHFALDDSGRLVDSDGRAVLDRDGRSIVISGDAVEVQADGTVLVDGEPLTRLQIVTPDGAGLTRAGATSFTASDPAADAATVDTTVTQGALEQSNIDTARAMTDLVAVQQSFEASQRVFLALSDNLERAVRDVGRVG